MALFSQYLANYYAPVPSFKTERGWHFGRIRVFNLFPVSAFIKHSEKNLNTAILNKGLVHRWHHVDHLLHTDSDGGRRTGGSHQDRPQGSTHTRCRVDQIPLPM